MFSSFFILSLHFVSAQESSSDKAVIIKLGGEVISADDLRTSQHQFSGKPISLDVLNADIHSLIRLFSAHSGQNFIISEGVQGKVSARIENVPWDQALIAILSSQGLVAVNIGEVIIIQ